MRRITSFLAVGSLALGCAPVFAGDKSGLEFWVTEVSDATPDAGEGA